MRIKSSPVRRTTYGPSRELWIGDVQVRAEVGWDNEGQHVTYAVVALPCGGTGAVRRIDDTDEPQWAVAGATGGWWPRTYKGLHQAVQALANDRAAG
jgi:hypothetical protein